MATIIVTSPEISQGEETHNLYPNPNVGKGQLERWIGEGFGTTLLDEKVQGLNWKQMSS